MDTSNDDDKLNYENELAIDQFDHIIKSLTDLKRAGENLKELQGSTLAANMYISIYNSIDSLVTGLLSDLHGEQYRDESNLLKQLIIDL